MTTVKVHGMKYVADLRDLLLHMTCLWLVLLLCTVHQTAVRHLEGPEHVDNGNSRGGSNLCDVGTVQASHRQPWRAQVRANRCHNAAGKKKNVVWRMVGSSYSGSQ